MALDGQITYYAVQADLNQGRQIARVGRDWGETSGGVATLEAGCRQRGFIHMLCGEFPQGRADLERSLALFDPGRRPFYADFSYDPLVGLLVHSSLLLSCAWDISIKHGLGVTARCRRRGSSPVPTP